jgi:hypothetical protein
LNSAQPIPPPVDSTDAAIRANGIPAIGLALLLLVTLLAAIADDWLCGI